MVEMEEVDHFMGRVCRWGAGVDLCRFGVTGIGIQALLTIHRTRDLEKMHHSRARIS